MMGVRPGWIAPRTAQEILISCGSIPLRPIGYIRQRATDILKAKMGVSPGDTLKEAFGTDTFGALPSIEGIPRQSSFLRLARRWLPTVNLPSHIFIDAQVRIGKKCEAACRRRGDAARPF
jgi:hypothetical protein